MSSLAASRADGYYYPPDFDPQKHGNINKYNNSHPLRERANKISEGILVIRFEMPFNVWCAGCNHLIGKGVRFNAEKKQIGNYHSTKIWSFKMTAPCCGQKIEVQTDPKNTDYVVTHGGRKKVETWDPTKSGTLVLEEKSTVIVDDEFSKLERKISDKNKAKESNIRVMEIYNDSNAKYKKDYEINKILRSQNRAKKAQELERDHHRKALGLSDDVKLLPINDEDRLLASAIQYGGKDRGTSLWQNRRRSIRSESIFAPHACTALTTNTSALTHSSKSRHPKSMMPGHSHNTDHAHASNNKLSSKLNGSLSRSISTPSTTSVTSNGSSSALLKSLGSTRLTSSTPIGFLDSNVSSHDEDMVADRQSTPPTLSSPCQDQIEAMDVCELGDFDSKHIPVVKQVALSDLKKESKDSLAMYSAKLPDLELTKKTGCRDFKCGLNPISEDGDEAEFMKKCASLKCMRKLDKSTCRAQIAARACISRQQLTNSNVSTHKLAHAHNSGPSTPRGSHASTSHTTEGKRRKLTLKDRISAALKRR